MSPAAQPQFDPEQQRQFAVEVTRALRAAGHEAYWAGGCVRDQLLGHVPSDYDVATSARPDDIREIFGKRRTLPIGAAFGVITVLGPKAAGQIEVATFREDADYSDGRRPDSVHFSTARDDAERRDFTINGMFYDPVAEEVIDFVDGQHDLKQGIVRAIGDAHDRIEEDKLRMLRAVRFTATFAFEIDQATAAAVRKHAPQLTVVSAERIGAEMRKMLAHKNRTHAIELLRETRLLEMVLPAEVTTSLRGNWQTTLDLLAALGDATLEAALTVLLLPSSAADAVAEISEHWRLSNRETDRTAWLLQNADALDGASTKPWPQVQRILVNDGIDDLVSLQAANLALGRAADVDLQFVCERLTWPAEKLNPAPLLSGDDLVKHGLTPGKAFRELLEAVRDAQLDGEIGSTAEALQLVDRLVDKD